VEFILDVGSHSLKLYRRQGMTQLVETVTWEPMADSEESAVATVGNLVKQIRESSPDAPVTAFGTEVMRRNSALSDLAGKTLGELGIDFHVISQEVEAQLISQAVTDSGAAPGQDVINVGGGSIQIIHSTGESRLLQFGIVDLNEKFNLLGDPVDRNLAGCTEFILGELPKALGPFVYTGGELTYLLHFDVPLVDGRCHRNAFISLAQRLERLPVDQLMQDSPYDPKWMKGAIASNCIVRALLDRSGTEAFVPSDLNIGHGVASQVTQAA
jgi:hypothetical protein